MWHTWHTGRLGKSQGSDVNGPTFFNSECSLTNPVCEHDPVCPSENMTPVNKDFWLLMAKIKD